MSLPIDRTLRSSGPERVSLTRSGWIRVVRGATTVFVLAPRATPAAAAAAAEEAGTAAGTLELLESSGECAVIEVGGPAPVLATDVNRSFPLFWTYRDGAVEVADDVRVLAAADPTADRDSVSQFRDAGFVLGGGTLYRTVRTTEADTIVTLTPEGPRMKRRHTFAVPADGPVDEAAEAADRYTEALLETVGSLVSNSPGRQFLVPLSGGVDSRFIVSALRVAGAQDVHTFTYGTPGSSEVLSSQKVAAAMELPWSLVTLDPRAMRARWRAGANASFVASTHSGSALPHIQDWYALETLKDVEAVSPGAIVLPGHSAVRTLKDAELLEHSELPLSDIVDAIIHRHFGQAGKPRRAVQDHTLRGVVTRIVEDFGYDGSPAAIARALQAVNILGRQCTYILNSVRAYEEYGHDWSLPLLNRRVHEVISSLNWELTQDRRWYASAAETLFRDVVGARAEGLEFWKPLPVSDTARTRVRDLLDRAHLRGAVERGLSLRTNLRHPMAFEAFAPGRLSYATSLVRGVSPFGVFAQAFLDNSWNVSFDWTAPRSWHTPALRPAVEP